MNILSLFDGMSCTQIALNRLGIKYDNYFVSEIDKYAVQVTQHNYPDTIQLGDIINWQDWKLPKIDLIVGGSPCQGFSNAGKGLNFDDPRSKLFFEFEKILKHYQPDYWLLENVVMFQEWQDIISQRLDIKPIKINSALVSAQNRERLYWTNINSQYDLFGNPYCAIPQPEDRRIVLADIIENGFVDREKSLVLDSGYQQTSETSTDRYFRKSGRQLVFNQPIQVDKINDSQDGKIVSVQGKSYTLSVGHNNYPKIQKPISKSFDYRSDNPTNLNSKKHPALARNAGSKTKGIAITENEQSWRKLTPLECERLQTVDDYYTLVLDESSKQLVSNNQRYKMLGNGMTVEVIAHIFSYMGLTFYTTCDKIEVD